MLLRMVSAQSKWDGSKDVNRDDGFICGDAISDLRTTSNTLSVWKADTQQDIEDAIVALALGRDKVQTLNYLLIDESELERMEIQISSDVLGDIKGLDEQIRKKHRDLIEMDYWRIGYLAEYMIGLVNKGKFMICTKKNIQALLEKYKNSNKIAIDNMLEKLRNDLKW